MAGLELEAQERVARDDQAFLRQPRAELVDATESRIEPVEPAQLTLRSGDARVVMMMCPLRRRRGKHHLPAERRAVDRILGQQPVQQRRAGARETGDEERPAHGLDGDPGMALALPLHAQPVRQQTNHVLPRGDPAEEAQLRRLLEVGDESSQRLVEARVAEIVEPGALPGLLLEQGGIGADQGRAARELEDAAATAQCARERGHADRASWRGSAALAAASTCQAISPGIPSTSSRTRFASDNASAMSGPSPTTRPSITYPPSCTPSAPGTAKAPARTACPRLSSMIASASPTGCPINQSTSQTSPVPTSQLMRCHALDAAMVRRCR